MVFIERIARNAFLCEAQSTAELRYQLFVCGTYSSGNRLNVNLSMGGSGGFGRRISDLCCCLANSWLIGRRRAWENPTVCTGVPRYIIDQWPTAIATYFSFAAMQSR